MDSSKTEVKQKEKEAGASPSIDQKKAELKLVDDLFEELKDEHSISDWELAGLIRFKRYLPGKSLKKDEFLNALIEYRKKRMGT